MGSRHQYFLRPLGDSIVQQSSSVMAEASLGSPVWNQKYEQLDLDSGTPLLVISIFKRSIRWHLCRGPWHQKGQTGLCALWSVQGGGLRDHCRQRRSPWKQTWSRVGDLWMSTLGIWVWPSVSPSGSFSVHWDRSTCCWENYQAGQSSVIARSLPLRVN